jgi:hypothetical protein
MKTKYANMDGDDRKATGFKALCTIDWLTGQLFATVDNIF